MRFAVGDHLVFRAPSAEYPARVLEIDGERCISCGGVLYFCQVGEAQAYCCEDDLVRVT